MKIETWGKGGGGIITAGSFRFGGRVDSFLFELGFIGGERRVAAGGPVASCASAGTAGA